MPAATPASTCDSQNKATRRGQRRQRVRRPSAWSRGQRPSPPSAQAKSRHEPKLPQSACEYASQPTLARKMRGRARTVPIRWLLTLAPHHTLFARRFTCPRGAELPGDTSVPRYWDPRLGGADPLRDPHRKSGAIPHNSRVRLSTGRAQHICILPPRALACAKCRWRGVRTSTCHTGAHTILGMAGGQQAAT